MSDPSATLVVLAAALVLDALLGEPEWLYRRIPHPVELAGRLIGWLDRRLNSEQDTPGQRRAGGIFVVALLVVGGAMAGTLIEALPFGALLALIAAAMLLAFRSLIQHVSAVAEALEISLAEGRGAVAKIVGRDPESLDEAGVARAAIESAAENFSDGVIAPAFWFAVAGLPGLVVYKLVNTADSMIGHATPRHRSFGWAAARLDDLLNLVPARLSALLIAAGAGSLPALKAAFDDAAKHRSPNAGWPEAALAGVLGLALAGPRRYGTTLVDDPWLNQAGRQAATPADIRLAVEMLWRAWGVAVALCLLLALVL